MKSPKATVLIADDSEILNNMLKDVFELERISGRAGFGWRRMQEYLS